MKKWGFFGYVAFVALNQMIMLSTGTRLPMVLIALAIIIAITRVLFQTDNMN